VLIGISISTAVQAIVFDRVAIVKPQYASEDGVNAEVVMTTVGHFRAANPTYSNVDTPTEAWPIASCGSTMETRDADIMLPGTE
jgi:hypothetical protein